jgi:drug/metabolite transporter (DMT)-like permease
MNEPEPIRPALWMLTASFNFAMMGSLAHAVGPRCDWQVIALIRIVSTFALSVALAIWAGVPLVFARPRTLWIRSSAGTLSLLCSFYALTKLPVADVLTLTNTYPLWIVLISWLRNERSTSWADLGCIVSGVLGVALVQSPYLSGKGNHASLIALVGTFATAVAMLGLHRLKTVDPRAVVAHFSGFATVTLTLCLLLRGELVSGASLDRRTVPLLLGVGLTGTIGQVLLTKAFASGAPARVSVLGLTQVLFAMLFDLIFEGRRVGSVSLAGFFLVLAPTAWITGRAGRTSPSETARSQRGATQLPTTERPPQATQPLGSGSSTNGRESRV